MDNKDLPAFPYKAERRVQVSEDIEQITPGDVPGMTLRDWFATHASEKDIENHKGDGYMEQYVEELDSGRKEIRSRRVFRSREEAKYRYADAMLQARKS